MYHNIFKMEDFFTLLENCKIKLLTGTILVVNLSEENTDFYFRKVVASNNYTLYNSISNVDCTAYQYTTVNTP